MRQQFEYEQGGSRTDDEVAVAKTKTVGPGTWDDMKSKLTLVLVHSLNSLMDARLIISKDYL